MLWLTWTIKKTLLSSNRCHIIFYFLCILVLNIGIFKNTTNVKQIWTINKEIDCNKSSRYSENNLSWKI